MNDFSTPAVADTPAPSADDVSLENEIADVFGLSLEPEGKPAPIAGEGVEPSSAPHSPATPIPAVAAAPASAPNQVENPPVPAAPATPELTPEERLAANAESASVDALKAKVAQLEEQIAKPVPQPASGSADEPDFVPPQYQLQIPDEVVNAIFDENPATAKAGMQHLINGLAAHLHKTIMVKTVLPLLSQHEAALKAPIAASETAAKSEQMRQQYYERHPTHSSPALRAVIAEENSALSAAFPQAEWNPDYMDALGARVSARMEEMAKAAGFAPVIPAPAPSTPAPAKPAAMMPATAPAPAANAEPDLADEVFQLFT